ncbi:MAG: amino acid ABC transporter permease [Alphaproteobacteria bacterium]
MLDGLANTALVSAIAIAIGTVLGLLLGLALAYGNLAVRIPARAYVDVMRGIPVLVLVFFSFYGLGLVGLDIAAFEAGAVALAGFCTAHIAELARGAIASIPVGQTEAAKSIGLGFWQRVWYVVLPQAARRILPPWVNTAVEIIKASSLLSVIGVVELLLATQQIIGRTYKPIPFYLIAAVVYFAICYAVSWLGGRLERRYAYLKY